VITTLVPECSRRRYVPSAQGSLVASVHFQVRHGELVLRDVEDLAALGEAIDRHRRGAESLWSTFKHEYYYRQALAMRSELVAAVDKWM
jgi:hypothetical protein